MEVFRDSKNQPKVPSKTSKVSKSKPKVLFLNQELSNTSYNPINTLLNIKFFKYWIVINHITNWTILKISYFLDLINNGVLLNGERNKQIYKYKQMDGLMDGCILYDILCLVSCYIASLEQITLILISLVS